MAGVGRARVGTPAPSVARSGCKRARRGRPLHAARAGPGQLLRLHLAQPVRVDGEEEQLPLRRPVRSHGDLAGRAPRSRAAAASPSRSAARVWTRPARSPGAPSRRRRTRTPRGLSASGRRTSAGRPRRSASSPAAPSLRRTRRRRSRSARDGPRRRATGRTGRIAPAVRAEELDGPQVRPAGELRELLDLARARRSG